PHAPRFLLWKAHAARLLFSQIPEPWIPCKVGAAHSARGAQLHHVASGLGLAVIIGSILRRFGHRGVWFPHRNRDTAQDLQSSWAVHLLRPPRICDEAHP